MPPTLKDRLYDSLPAGRYAFAAMLRLLEIVETDAVPTAAVSCAGRPRLRVNPAFVERHAATAERLTMLVLHELHHVLLGHTQRLGGPTRVDNFIADAVINALLSRMFPQSSYTAFFRDLYRDDAFPECLLRPPEGWDPARDEVPLPPALEGAAMAAAAQVYRALYTREGATEDDVRQVLRPLLLRQAGGLDGVLLLGDHGPDRPGSPADDGVDPAGESRRLLQVALAGVTARWPAGPPVFRGRTLGTWLRETGIVPRADPTLRRQLHRLIRRVAAAGGRVRGGERPLPAVATFEQPGAVPDRRGLVLRTLGFAPLLHTAPAAARPPRSTLDRVHVYLDVSSSMDAVTAALGGAVLDCGVLVHPRVHAFSTEVADVTLAQLAAGVVRSTGGTDIACVIDHLRTHRVRNAVVLTDGFVGPIDDDGARTLRGVRLGLALVGEHVSREGLAPFAAALTAWAAPDSG